jgi:septum formation protein
MLDLKYRLLLGSKSPRRKQLLDSLDLPYQTVHIEVEENYPKHLKREEVALYLCQKKSVAYELLQKNDLLITADTIVCIDNKILNKPADYTEAVNMLETLSGKMHEVITAVCLRSVDKQKSFFSVTEVYFKTLLRKEIEYYLENYHPYDKAGAYGAQDWIGMAAIEKINGSYFNVMGLPTKKLYDHLKLF